MVNLVDALDGIDLDIQKGEEVDILYANGQPGLSVGQHHVDGETALAFAREKDMPIWMVTISVFVTNRKYLKLLSNVLFHLR